MTWSENADQFIDFCFSSSNLIDEEQVSEFWNREDEASGSEEDISDSEGKPVAWFCDKERRCATLSIRAVIVLCDP